jgi:hypothetical protein
MTGQTKGRPDRDVAGESRYLFVSFWPQNRFATDWLKSAYLWALRGLQAREIDVLGATGTPLAKVASLPGISSTRVWIR